MATAMKLPPVFAPGNARVEVVVVPASLFVCCTSEIAACALPNPPASKRRSTRTRKREMQLRITEELRRKLIDIGHPPRIKNRFSLTRLRVSFSGAGHTLPLVTGQTFPSRDITRVGNPKPHTTQVGWLALSRAECLALRRLRQPHTCNAVPSVLRTVPARRGGAIPFPKGYGVNPMKQNELHPR